MVPIKLKAGDIPRHLRRNYVGRKFTIQAVSHVTIPSDANVWGGGSRSQYYAIRLSDGAEVVLGSLEAPWDPSRNDKTIAMTPGIAIVRHSIFQGHDMGLEFHVHPANLPKFIK